MLTNNLEIIIEDYLIEHFDIRTKTQKGKAMIVCMSREICVKFYEALRKLKPELHDNDVTKGQMKVVMTLLLGLGKRMMMCQR